MKAFRNLLIGLMVVVSTALVITPTFAQDTPPLKPTVEVTITLTQEQINARVENRRGERLKDLSIVLGDNQITVSFSTKVSRKDTEPKAIVAIVSPSLVEGHVKWTLDSLTIDGTPAAQEQIDLFKERVVNLVPGRFGERQRRFNVTAITVDSKSIIISMTRNVQT